MSDQFSETPVTRISVAVDEGGIYSRSDPKGPYVRWEDHCREIERVRARVADLVLHARRWRAVVDPQAGHPKVLDLVAAIDRFGAQLSGSETRACSDLPLPAEGLTWEQFWQRVREIEFNPSPGELRAALRRYEERECPKCHKQLEDDEIFGSCMDRGDGVHRRAIRD